LAADYSNERRIILWEDPNVTPCKTIIWNTYCTNQSETSIISLPAEVERHADKLKAFYLGWAYKRLGFKTLNEVFMQSLNRVALHVLIYVTK